MENSTAKKPLVDELTTIPTNSSNFIRTWLEVKRPFHKLTTKEMDFAAVLLNNRCEIAEKISDQNIVDKLLFEEENKEKICEQAGVSKAYMQNILRKMRDNGILSGKRVNPEYRISRKKGEPFRMLFVFKNEA